MVHQPVYEAAQESSALIAKYQASQGTEDLEPLPVKQHIKKLFPDIYRAPLLRRQYCKMLVEEIEEMKEMGLFAVNDEEDQLRQIPEIVLRNKVPELYRTMYFLVQSVLQPIFFQLYQRNCADIASIQLANYNIRDKQQGAWHHDESADISVVVPLNSGDYDGGRHRVSRRRQTEATAYRARAHLSIVYQTAPRVAGCPGRSLSPGFLAV